MTAILSSIAGNLLEMIVLAAVAAAGVVCGHKYRDHKEAQKAAAGEKETK